jgi:hypothetical protein
VIRGLPLAARSSALGFVVDGHRPFRYWANADCNNLNPAVCDGSVITNGTCAEVSACAAASSAAPAPSLDATGLAIGIIVLGGLAALRLRRPAKQPLKSPPGPPRQRDKRQRD